MLVPAPKCPARCHSAKFGGAPSQADKQSHAGKPWARQEPWWQETVNQQGREPQRSGHPRLLPPESRHPGSCPCCTSISQIRRVAPRFLPLPISLDLHLFLTYSTVGKGGDLSSGQNRKSAAQNLTLWQNCFVGTEQSFFSGGRWVEVGGFFGANLVPARFPRAKAQFRTRPGFRTSPGFPLSQGFSKTQLRETASRPSKASLFRRQRAASGHLHLQNGMQSAVLEEQQMRNQLTALQAELELSRRTAEELRAEQLATARSPGHGRARAPPRWQQWWAWAPNRVTGSGAGSAWFDRPAAAGPPCASGNWATCKHVINDVLTLALVAIMALLAAAAAGTCGEPAPPPFGCTRLGLQRSGRCPPPATGGGARPPFPPRPST